MSIMLEDDRRRPISLATPPQRIVSLVPSDTFTALRLGAGLSLVGRTRYCVEPRLEVERIEVIGGARDPDLARIVELRPDLVLASQEDNLREHVEALEAAGVQVLVGSPRSARQALDHVERLALLFPEHASANAAQLQAARASLARFELRPRRPLRLLVVLWPDPLVTVGPGTFASDVLRVLGADNVLELSPVAARSGCESGSPSYPRLTLGALAELGPELVLLPDEPYAYDEADAAELGEQWPAVPGRPRPQVRCCDGKDLFWYGLRAVEGLARLAALLDAARGAAG